MKRSLMLFALLLAAGCELPDTTEAESSGPAAAAQNATASSTSTAGTSGSSTSTAGASDASTNTAGDSEWGSIQWHGDSCAGATQVMTLSASVSGGSIRFSFSSWPWGGNMGLGHFFWWNGTTWEGGKFDWIRAGGQAVKGTDNIRGGYNGLRVPASGTAVAFAWTNADGTQRSNLATTTWP